MCRWFAHSLGICKASHPLNNLSRPESQHSRPSLGLIHPESNWKDVKNTANALWAQYNLNTSNSGSDWSTRVGKIGSKIVTTGSHPIRPKSLSNLKYWSWEKLILLPRTTFLWANFFLYCWYSLTELKRVVSYLAFRRASIWSGWDSSAERLPWALEVVVSLLGAIKKAEMRKVKLVERESHIPEGPKRVGMSWN